MVWALQKNTLAVPQKLQFPYSPVILLLDIYPRELKNTFTQKLVHHCSQHLYSQQPKGGNHPDDYRLMNEQTKCGGCIVHSRVVFGHKRNEVLLHSTTRMNLKSIRLSERSQTQEHILYNSIYMKCSEWVDLLRQTSLVVVRGQGKGWRVTATGYGVSFWDY